MINKLKILKIIIIVITSIVLFFIIANINNKELKLNFEFKYDKNNLLFNGREIYLKDNELSIGNNKKELENGYYDIKFEIKNKKILNIYVNKLFKSFNEKNIYNEEYINDIIFYINKIFNYNFDESELKDIILINYCNIRKNSNGKILKNKYKLKLNNQFFDISVENKENILKIEMRC